MELALREAATEGAGCGHRPFSRHPRASWRTGRLQLRAAGPITLDERLPIAIGALRSLYQARREPLRLEFNEEPGPSLVGVERAGLTLRSRNPLMACEPQEFRPFTAPVVGVRFLAVDPRHPSTRRAVGELDGQVAGRASLGSVEGVAELTVWSPTAVSTSGRGGDICSALGSIDSSTEGGPWSFARCGKSRREALYEGLGFAGRGANYGSPPDPLPHGEGV